MNANKADTEFIINNIFIQYHVISWRYKTNKYSYRDLFDNRASE